MIFEWDGTYRQMILPTFFGGVLGLIAGIFGERWGRFKAGRNLVIFWACFWAATWVLITLITMAPLACIGLLAGPPLSEMVQKSVGLGCLVAILIGSIGGALGGMIIGFPWIEKQRP
jgi:hypothetical protein